MDSELRWLLDRAAEWRVFVRLVLPESMDQVAQWNAPCPRWKSKQVFAALRELEELGWVEFSIVDSEGRDIPAARPAFNHQALIDAYKLRREPLLYRLTDLGSAEWERAARPDWTHKYQFEIVDTAHSEEHKEHECVVTAANEDVARRALLITACEHNLLVVPGTERFAACGGWNATYWKRIDAGVQATATVGADDYDFRLDFVLPMPALRRYAESSRLFSRWYVRAEQPDWQFHEYLEYGGMWGGS